jgi:hypothetical protein
MAFLIDLDVVRQGTKITAVFQSEIPVPKLLGRRGVPTIGWGNIVLTAKMPTGIMQPVIGV